MRRHVIGGMMVLVCGAVALADDKAQSPAQANFERLKKLVGTWVEADKDGKPTDKVVSVVKLTAGGSAVSETLFPGTDQEMLSVYHLDGKDLVMTHYCMLGNAPDMRVAKSDDKTIALETVAGNGIDPKTTPHMHGVVYELVDKDHLRATWTSANVEEKQGKTPVFEYARVR